MCVQLPTCFIYTTSRRKQTMGQQLHRACEQMKLKSKENQSHHIQIHHAFDLAHKQCNGIIKG